MLAIDLLSDEIPPLKTSDTGTRALQWMDEFKISELPIVNNRQFLGLITESDILDLSDPDEAIGNHKLSMEQAVVHQYEHVYEVISKMATHKLKIIPVLDDDTNYIGVISQQILLDNISKLAAMKDPGGILQLEMNVNDYSLSEISSYVYTHLDSTKMDVTIKINQTDLSAIIQTFERYQYTISASFHKSEMESELRKKFEAFIHYLNM